MKTYSHQLTQEYLDSLNCRDVSFFKKRENIPFAIQDFMLWILKNYGLSLRLVKGYFLFENFVFDKEDFTFEMKTEFKKSGLNFNKKEDRKFWIENNLYSHELKKIPHEWCEDIVGNIYDPFGFLQFFLSKKTPDLLPNRYIEL